MEETFFNYIIGNSLDILLGVFCLWVLELIKKKGANIPRETKYVALAQQGIFNIIGLGKDKDSALE